MIRRLREPRSDDPEFDRALVLRPVWWIRDGAPGTYHMTFWSALRAWWWERRLPRLYAAVVERCGRWEVRDGQIVLAHSWTARGARRLCDQLNFHDNDRWRVERRNRPSAHTST